MKKVYLIINPKAGKTKAKTDMYNIISVFCQNEYEVTTVFSAYKGHAEKLAETAASDKYDFLVCYGGDGTLNEVAGGVLKSGTDMPIGYIPAGSTNDFAASLKLPTTAGKAAANIVNGTPVPIDVGKFNDRYFMYIASFGAFTAVSYNTPQDIKNALGHFAYVLQGIKDIGTIVPYKVKVTADGNVYEDEYIFGSIGNSKSIGGIVKLKDELVSMNDGMFEGILVKQPKTPIDLNNIIMGISFSDFSNDMFEFFRASSITVESADKFDWSLDGEFYEGGNTVTIGNIHDGIKIMTVNK